LQGDVINVAEKTIMNTYSRILYVIFSFRGKWLDVNPNTEEPSNIRWENLQYSVCKRFGRIFLTVLVTLIVLIISIIYNNSFKYN